MRRLPLALLLAALPVTLTACHSGDEATAGVESGSDDVGEPALLGRWTVAQLNGQTPASEVTLQFTPQGDMIRTQGGAVRRATYSFVGNNEVEISDARGVTLFTYAVEDDDTILLRTSGSDPSALRLARRGDGVELSDVEPARTPRATPPDTAATSGMTP